MSQEKSRLAGEQAAIAKRQAESEEQCREEFECSIDDLPAMLERLEQEVEASVLGAEVVLGLREAPPQVVAPKVVAPKIEKRRPVREAIQEPSDTDEDGMGI